MLSFTVNATEGLARCGLLTTAHGNVRTPAFMPVGTAASVKGLTSPMIEECGPDIILGNTYHLMLNNTHERIGQMGGLHRFMNWKKPILTDSGGFQVLSLTGLRKITEDGVKFRSHLDGSLYYLTPEKSMEIQYNLGANITMILDECTPYPITYKKAKKSMELSLRWAERSKNAFIKREGHGLFGIVQGSVYRDLREKSAQVLLDIGFDGYALGGVALGEGAHSMFTTLDYTVPMLPQDKPRYLMGIGKPLDIIGSVKRGVDMFDCVLPTRNARNGLLYTRHGEIKIRHASYALIDMPLDKDCRCFTCKNHTLAYLHHLCRRKEILFCTLATIHNTTFFQDMMASIRSSIQNKNFIAVAGKAEKNDFTWIA